MFHYLKKVIFKFKIKILNSIQKIDWSHLWSLLSFKCKKVQPLQVQTIYPSSTFYQKKDRQYTGLQGRNFDFRGGMTPPAGEWRVGLGGGELLLAKHSDYCPPSGHQISDSTIKRMTNNFHFKNVLMCLHTLKVEVEGFPYCHLVAQTQSETLPSCPVSS